MRAVAAARERLVLEMPNNRQPCRAHSRMFGDGIGPIFAFGFIGHPPVSAWALIAS